VKGNGPRHQTARGHGLITFDPGFGNTGACRSAITFIDGEQGILRYRGYDIAELAERSTFLEVAWLLLRGELPTKGELASITDEITHHTMLDENFRRFFDALPKDAHPMPVCSAAVAGLATFYQGAEDGEAALRETVVRLIAKMPTIAAYSYKHSIGQPFMYPKNRLDYVSNFLYMMFGTPCEDFEVDPVLARALDLLLILHADHEQNCSTSTVRVVGSSRANLFASVSAGISALWGPLHGGANQQVIEMLERIEAEGGDVQKFVNAAKDKKQSSRLMGFGHRVYKNYDPRAAILRKACVDVLTGSCAERAARPRDEARGDRVEGRVLHQPQAVPERGLLLRPHLQGPRHSSEHVHGDVRHRPHARLDRPVVGEPQ
jgi:citrate synthase